MKHETTKNARGCRLLQRGHSRSTAVFRCSYPPLPAASIFSPPHRCTNYAGTCVCHGSYFMAHLPTAGHGAMVDRVHSHVGEREGREATVVVCWGTYVQTKLARAAGPSRGLRESNGTTSGTYACFLFVDQTESSYARGCKHGRVSISRKASPVGGDACCSCLINKTRCIEVRLSSQHVSEVSAPAAET